MHLFILILILLFSCPGFCSYGKDSSAKSDTITFYKKQLQSISPVYGNILFTSTSNRISFTYPGRSRSSGFQLYQRQQQSSTAKTNFQNIDIKTEAGIILVNNRNLKTSVTNPDDSFLSKQSTIPLLRNEHAGIWKKIGRAELFIGGVELLG